MKKFLKNYWFILCMLAGIVAGCLVGAFAPSFGSKIEFLGTLFINMMFCVVVPMVFCSIASAIANMKSVKRAGKIMGVTIATFLVTAAIAGVLMYIVCRIFPLVDGHYTIVEGEVGEALGFGDMIVNFFTKPDFAELLSRRAILPLIVAAVLFGFGVQMNGGPETKTAQFLEDITNCIMKTVKLVTYYAPIGFFGFFASLVATYGPTLIGDYSRTLIIYYVMSFAYMFIFFPIYARFGGGRGRRQADVLQAVPPGGGVLRHLLQRGYHSHQYGGSGGVRHQQGRDGHRAAPGRYHAHGRLGHVRHHQGGISVRRVRDGLLHG